MGKLKDIFGTATFKQSSLVSAATIVNGFLGLLFYVVTPRFLGPSLFGLFSVSVAVGTAVSDISDFGINTGIVKFVGRHSNEPQIANKYLKLSFKIKFAVALVVFAMGFLISPFLAENVFGKPELTAYLRISFLGVVFSLVFGFITAALQAYQKFTSWSAIQIGTNFLRLILVITFVSVGLLTLTNSLFVYILMPLTGFFVGCFLLKQKFWKVKNENSKFKELLNFNKWVALFIVVAAISSRLDTFISAKYLSNFDLGLYSVAVQLTQVIPQMAGALSTVIAPKMAGMTSFSTFLVYYRKVQLMVLGLSGLGLVGIPIGIFLIPVLYGDSYRGTSVIFIILFIAMLIFLISIPIHNAIIYYYSYSKFFWWLSLGHLGIILICGLNFIPRYGVIGAAVSVMIGSVFNFVAPALWLVNKINYEERQ